MHIETTNLSSKWKQYEMRNDHGMSVQALNYGGIITKIITPDRKGNMENVILGYRNINDYESNPNFFGALIGRVAGRVEGASFELAGKTYTLEQNEGAHHLHGGSQGFHTKIWDAEPFQTEETVGVTFTVKSQDGDGGYPGNLTVNITYTLTNQNQLAIDYEATSDKSTPIALTNHTYFNLSGNLKRTVHDHEITLDSSQFLELNKSLIPTGKVLDVTNTPFDFRNEKKVQEGICSDMEQNVIAGNGYDHYFIFDKDKKESVSINEEESGRIMHIETDQPGMVMYTATHLTEEFTLAEATSEKYLGICFETQGSPASLHHNGLPDIIVKANEPYKKRTIFSFNTL